MAWRPPTPTMTGLLHRPPSQGLGRLGGLSWAGLVLMSLLGPLFGLWECSLLGGGVRLRGPGLRPGAL